ncbi:hypothetical protein AA0119_g1231 [Alternaria tenuissima]|uniref:Uncharacterized protein n=1 Tax=Alternaria tenuissima TaxID=119927 RepID=A0AB37WWQ8_9PLEO|nr:hypothetical protein AA0115_g2211 [Alternaria tenuissima]RYO08870.1 hypothetical protein AA0119_g1231 [Alternaria tenuissima]RYO22368.1 hypothetical protein AA0121_g2489 [Alternaria tenuissima]
MSCAKNHGTETQAVFRPVRVNSPREVEIIKMFVKDSICGYRESKKSDKYVVELATRAQDPKIRALAVEMLNEYHKEVQSAQKDPENAELMGLLCKERDASLKRRRETQEEARAATTTVPESTQAHIDLSNIVGSKRERKRPERFGDVKWSDSGKRLGTVSEAERRAAEGLFKDEDEEDGKSFLETHKYDLWKEVNWDTDDDDVSDYEGTDVNDSDIEEEIRERPLTDKQQAKIEAKAARMSKPKVDEAARQLAIKLLDDFNRVYTDDDLDEDVHLTRALRLIHAKKVGLAFNDVPSVHIMYTRFSSDMLEAIKKKSKLENKSKPLLKHILSRGRAQDFVAPKSNKRQSGGAESSTKRAKARNPSGSAGSSGAAESSGKSGKQKGKARAS